VFEARGLTKRFGRLTALRPLDLRVSSGEVLAVFGRNGAGKTTFLHLAASLTRPTAGEVLYEGRPAAEHRRHVGLLSHASFLYSDLTARENLEFYARLYGVEVSVDDVLAEANLAARANAPVRTLSRGMHQRLAVARALLHRPKLLLLDEPYTGLDAVSAEKLSMRLRTFGGPAFAGGFGEASPERAVILTTHDLERGLEVATRVAILDSGRLAYDGGPLDPRELRERFAALTSN